jgi:phage/plasmid primase-like uncharacterized protein
MSYKTYAEQLTEHIRFLQSQGLSIEQLNISGSFIRCPKEGQSGRGELCYKSTLTKLNNGTVGIATWCRGLAGLQTSYQTYGLGPAEGESAPKVEVHSSQTKESISEMHCSVAKKAYGFWQHSSVTGSSDYLGRKSVGSYGIRFRQSDQYGNVAVIPMYDSDGKLWSYQLLNLDGKKRHPKDARTKGLFYKLKEPVNGKPIGIAESYVTAATCMELSDIPMVCAFSSSNLFDITKLMLSLHPASPIIIFGDNDRHLEKSGNQNVGRLKAQEAQNLSKNRIILAIPDFYNLEPSKEASDWNDLVRLKGKEFARNQILSITQFL